MIHHFSPHLLKRGYIGDYIGTTMGDIKGDTRAHMVDSGK